MESRLQTVVFVDAADRAADPAALVEQLRRGCANAGGAEIDVAYGWAARFDDPLDGLAWALKIHAAELKIGVDIVTLDTRRSWTDGRLVAQGRELDTLCRLTEGCLAGEVLAGPSASARLGAAGFRAASAVVRPVSAHPGVHRVLPRTGVFRRVRHGVLDPSNLPTRLDRFVGRDREIDAALDRLADGVVCLAGIGGVGKTRLAVALAERAGADRPTYFVGASGAVDDGELAERIARVVGLPLERGQGLQHIIEVLGRAGAVVVIDELPDAIDPPRADGARFIVTRRSGRPGDIVLGPLSQTDALALARERIWSLGSAAGEPEQEELVTAAGCLPLAIELLAARFGRLGHASFSHTPEPVAASIQLSIEVLDPEARDALEAATMFRERFHTDDLGQLTSAPDAAVAELITAHLLAREGHLLLLPRPVRDSVDGLLDDERREELWQRYVGFIEQSCADVGGALDGPDEIEASAEFERRLPDVREVLSYLRDSDPARAWSLLVPIERVLDRRGPLPLQAEVVDDALAATTTAAPNERATALLIAGRTRRWQSDPAGSEAAFETALELATVAETRSTALLGLAAVAQQGGDYERAYGYCLAAVECTQDTGTASEAHSHAWCGYCAQHLGRQDDARRHLHDAMLLARHLGNPSALCTTLKFAGPMFAAHGELDQARNVLDEALELSRRLGGRRGEVGILYDLSQLSLSAGAGDAALGYVDEALEITRLMGARHYEGVLRFARGDALFTLDRLDAAAADFERCLECLGTDTVVSVSVRALAYLGAIDALQGSNETAEVRFAKAGELIGTAQMPVEQAMLDILRLAATGENVPSMDGIHADPEVDRVAATLSQQMARRRGNMVDLVVSDDGRWFQVAGSPTVDITRRKALRGILVALVARHAAKTSLTLEETVTAGWPDEIITWEAAARRVYSTINRLRDLGIGDLLVTTDDGYMLEPDCRVRWG